jgi:outer membrane immunogenic protein
MRRLLLASASALVLAAVSNSAFAADIIRRTTTVTQPESVIVRGYNWTGLYIGLNGGGAWGSSDWGGGFGSTNVSGGLVGLTLGYNWQGLGSPWVFGLEGDINWTNIRGSYTSVLCPAGCETRNNWLGTLRGRIGYAFDRVMPYVTGGLAFGDIEVNPAGFNGVSDTKAGWTVGAGIEAAIAPNWTAKVEYLHVDIGSVGCGVPACGAATGADLRANVVRAGLNYRF